MLDFPFSFIHDNNITKPVYLVSEQNSNPILYDDILK